MLFNLFAFAVVMSALMVVLNRNPVYSALFLILSFFCSAVLFLMIGADFLAMLLLIVYIGAVAVLFLFVVMMLNIRLIGLRERFVKSTPIGIAVTSCLCVLMCSSFYCADYTNFRLVEMNAIRDIGRVLYTDYAILFHTCGAVLLTAMIGAVVLALYKDETNNKTRTKFMTRSVKDSIEIVKVKSGKGLGECDES